MAYTGPPPTVPAPAQNDLPVDSKVNQFLNKQLTDISTDIEYTIKSSRIDPQGPLYSGKTFTSLRLKPELLRALNELGFIQPSKIQEMILPVLLMAPPQNVIAQAQSGTGKTVAFALAMLSRVDPTKNYPQAICLAPTFELALQIGDVIKDLGKHIDGLSWRFAVKGAPLERNTQITEHIIIGTPGKAHDWIIKFKALDPSKIVAFVLDEADQMISMQGIMEQSIRLHQEVENHSQECQTMLFSATYTEELIKFAETIVKDAYLLTLQKKEQNVPYIRQFVVPCTDRMAKYRTVVNLFRGITISTSIIFCHTKSSVDWLADQMMQRGYVVGVLHSNMSIEDRAHVIDQFRNGEFKLLITTNVCARGIDVPQVTMVINYDIPVTHDTAEPDFETYIHRIGRTGRFGHPGIAVNFADSDRAMEIVQIIATHFGVEIQRLDTEDDSQLERIENEKRGGL
ncbi:hypothetical protein L596_027400 [Steinernema carpocapsae]|uniref:RNA helicase n=1 Tax=Steinernema carpocapsae TaxID=34508 RepID=A0A4U5M484_STECR|nr:hypothetical protein L596_027400 [Steinernema carpocapsae]